MIRVRLDDLPHRIKGLCYHDNDGNEYITINARLSTEQQRIVFRHELRHIRRREMYDLNYKEYEEKP